MMKFLTIVLSVLIQQIVHNINEMTLTFETDQAKVERIDALSGGGSNYLVYILELYFRTPVTEQEVADIISLQNPDGSWRDIDYDDRKKSQCEQTLHAVRFQRLAIFHRQHPQRQDVARALHSALSFWEQKMPETSNWFYNQINIPKAFAPGFLLFMDEMTSHERETASQIMRKAKLTRTGQNLVWEAGNLLIAGLLENDEALVRKTASIIQSEIKLSRTIEGLQPDWSFLQHGPQLQFGNYGQSFVVSQAWWAKAFKGTELELPEEKMKILRDYVVKGVGRTIWGGYMDHNALGRQIFPQSQVSKALSLEYAMQNLGISAEDIEKGPRYYPNADFCNYRSDNWYASVRMQSSRTIGYEATNNENMKAYFSADGALLVRRTGDEYIDIAPVWNWHHVPGTTVYDDGKQLWGTHGRIPFNKSSKVFGAVEGDMMVVAMEYDRDSVKARKVWAFNSDAILCLGHGISSMREDDEIVTTVEQTRLKGAVISGKDYVSHNGITYVTLGDPFSFAGKTTGRGNWTAAARYYGDETIEAEMFEINISHGVSPENDTYRYCVLPGGMSPRDAARYVRRNIEIMSDSRAKMGTVSFSIDWDNEKITF